MKTRAAHSQTPKTSTKDGKKHTRSAIGAPTQLGQSSRKGKRAWRKNVDVQDVEEGLENLRAEERVIGSTLQKQPDNQLFVVDTKGDEQVRKSLPRFSRDQLMSAKILARRSAVPAVVSRVMKAPTARLTPAEKERLLRLTKRPFKGPFNSLVSPKQVDLRSTPLDVSHAARASGKYDIWTASAGEETIHSVPEAVQKRPVMRPETNHPHDVIDIPAVALPPQGASYNPPAQEHYALVVEAYKIEKRKQDEVDRLAQYRERIERAEQITTDDTADGVPPGMCLDEIDEDAEGTLPESNMVVPRKPPVRKTKQQRARMERHRAEKRALAEKAMRKQLLHSVTLAKSIASQLNKTLKSRQEALLARQLAARIRVRRGLAGQWLGGHKVPDSRVDVQIGEDLCENLRLLKPEGNLFRDRFVSLQQRALVEPRVPVLPSKRKFKPVLYEKHAWKQFG